MYSDQIFSSPTKTVKDATTALNTKKKHQARVTRSQYRSTKARSGEACSRRSPRQAMRKAKLGFFQREIPKKAKSERLTSTG